VCRGGAIPSTGYSRPSPWHRERDLEWLDLCIKLRSSGMPLAAIRRYAELVREGPGNEKERLDILRQHQQRVTAQIAALTMCLQMISFKVNLYQNSLTADTSDPIWRLFRNA